MQQIFGAEVRDIYRKNYVSVGGEQNDVKEDRYSQVKKKMLSSLSNRITCTLFSNQKGNIYYSRALSAEAAMNLMKEKESSMQPIRKIALQLRDSIKRIRETQNMPETTVENMMTTAPDIPDVSFKLSYIVITLKTTLILLMMSEFNVWHLTPFLIALEVRSGR